MTPGPATAEMRSGEIASSASPPACGVTHVYCIERQLHKLRVKNADNT